MSLGKVMKIGICIDSWKLPIFERHLAQAGFDWDVYPGVAAETFTISVEADSIPDIHNAVKQANLEAARTPKP